MNINLKAKRILIFGDSNTWGAMPTGRSRFPVDVRYPGVVQKLLGDGYEIIEEGLPGRTLCAGDEEEREDGKIGIEYAIPCFASHAPIDLLVINLGTNEYKKKFALTAKDIANHLGRLFDAIYRCHVELQERDRTAEFQTLILAPGHVDGSLASENFSEAGELSTQVAPLFQAFAEERGFSFLDLAPVAHSGEDGVHYTAESHTAIAEAVTKKIREIFND